MLGSHQAYFIWHCWTVNLWGYEKSQVYKYNPQSIFDLKDVINCQPQYLQTMLKDVHDLTEVNPSIWRMEHLLRWVFPSGKSSESCVDG